MPRSVLCAALGACLVLWGCSSQTTTSTAYPGTSSGVTVFGTLDTAITHRR